jgi:Gluconate 2-dehydrogenase subunit 3
VTGLTGRVSGSSEARAGAAGLSPARGGRFPGFNALDQASHWDPVTAGVVLSRLGRPPDIRFFTPAEVAAATALCDRLLGQDDEPKVPVVPQIDARLAEQETDGWRYAGMPEDGQAWRDSLHYLDADCETRFSCPLAAATAEDQQTVIQAVQDLGARDWHGLTAGHVWSLWTRYACTALYAHPSAWTEMGFPGPAYPRGYKNPGVNTREPFEVADARSSADPVEGDR